MSSKRRRADFTTSKGCGVRRRASSCPRNSESAAATRFFEKGIVIEMVARSEAMREVLRLAERVAATDANVLVTGESGAGKDALALFIHAQSQRGRKPSSRSIARRCRASCWKRSCLAMSAARSRARREAKPGRLEAAHKGTLVLDEIAHLPSTRRPSFCASSSGVSLNGWAGGGPSRRCAADRADER